MDDFSIADCSTESSDCYSNNSVLEVVRQWHLMEQSVLPIQTLVWLTNHDKCVKTLPCIWYDPQYTCYPSLGPCLFRQRGECT